MDRHSAGLLLVATFASACGGARPATSVAPSIIPAPTPVTVNAVIDGITGARVSAQPQGTDPVTVTAPGYLTRQQPLSSVVFLWPQPEAYVRDTIYSGGEFCLIRWPEGSTLRFAFTAELGQYDSFLAQMAAEAARWSRLPIVALPAGDPTANVRFAIDPAANDSANALAITNRTFTTGTCKIAAANVVFREPRIIDGGQRNNTLLHEIGHVLGLDHSPDSNDVMSVDARRSSERAFGGNERLALTMMYVYRKAGNAFPDRERVGLTSLSDGVRRDAVACR